MNSRSLARSLIACSVAVILSLSLARVHPFGDPKLFAPQAGTPLLDSSVPPEVRALLTGKCADCHSIETRTPFYGRFAPISWLLERDIVEGRKRMDLSHWESYSADQRQGFQAQIVQQADAGKMPLPQYLLIHHAARITESDLWALEMWAVKSRAQPEFAVSSAPADAVRGKAVFEKRCTGCHALNRDDEGPRLAGVYGRRSGAVPRFPYSDPLRRANILWDDKSLEAWLANPDALVPGNGMPVSVAKPDERRDLIAYLEANPR